MYLFRTITFQSINSLKPSDQFEANSVSSNSLSLSASTHALTVTTIIAQQKEKQNRERMSRILKVTSRISHKEE